MSPSELPQLPPQSKCTRCRSRALVSLPSHNARFCEPCFQHFFQNAVQKALKKYGPNQDTPILVAVSGGKDSLALWAVLQDLGLHTRGIHLDLGLGEFSLASSQAVQEFAEQRGLEYSHYSLLQEFGFSLPEIQALLPEKICSICGRLKRQLLNHLAAREGYSWLATGHNLDDEASRLLGNLLGDRQEFVRRQSPGLPSPHPRIPAKIKPLYRLEIKEILAFCELQGIKPAQAGCPMSKGATSHYFKEALDLLEDRMPGTKRGFLYSYLRKPKELQMQEGFQECQNCGEPAYSQPCPVCSLRKRLKELQSKKGTNPAPGRGRKRRRKKSK
ncbi:MAG: ATP-binding protein [Thermodesulfobacteriota bacterium]